MFVKFLKFVAEKPRIPFYPFIFLYHENMEFRVFCGIFNEIFKKFRISFLTHFKEPKSWPNYGFRQQFWILILTALEK